MRRALKTPLVGILLVLAGAWAPMAQTSPSGGHPPPGRLIDIGGRKLQRPVLRVLTTRSIATVLEKIGPEFERQTGCELDVATDVAARMVRRISAGEPFDFLVAAPAQIDGLIRAGKIIPETRT